MVLDIKNIDTIDKAKSANYGGSPLGNDDKAIFVEANFKKPDGSLDVNQLKATAELLDLVKRADKLTKKDIAVIGKLQREQRDNTSAFRLVNAVNKQVENTIAKIENLEGTHDDPKVKEEQIKLLGIREQIKVKKVEKKVLEGDLDRILEKSADDEIKVKREDKKLRAFDELLKDLKADGAAKNIIKGIEAAGKKFVTYTQYTDTCFREVTIDKNKYFLTTQDENYIA
jgi:hypothetical protein